MPRLKRFFKMKSVAGIDPDTTNKPHEEPKMTASQLAYRSAMSDLIEHHLEPALSLADQLPPPPAEVIVHFDADPDLLAGDDDLDLIQAEAESDFFIDLQAMRGSRSVRRALRSW